MRFKKVKILEWVTGCGLPVRKECCGEGKFLQFSTSGELLEGATEVCSSALVLIPDGNVVELPVNLIQFVGIDYEAL